jgi:hypothetical protein
MRDTSTRTELIERLHFPGRAAADPAAPAGLVRAARIATWLWLVIGAVNVVVWVMVCSISASIDRPWWAWEIGGGGPVVGALWLTVRSYRGRDDRAAEDQRDFAEPAV